MQTFLCTDLLPNPLGISHDLHVSRQLKTLLCLDLIRCFTILDNYGWKNECLWDMKIPVFHALNIVILDRLTLEHSSFINMVLVNTHIVYDPFEIISKTFQLMDDLGHQSTNHL